MKVSKNSKLINSILIALFLFVSTSSAFALPPDPDNAALLYYQVFLLYEKPDDTMKDMVADLAKGKIEPDTRTTQFIESQKTVIRLVVTATELPNCNWGLKYSDGLSLELPYLSRTRHLTWLILADARTIAANGDYELAIDRCLTARKLALHAASEPIIINFLVGISIEKLANKCIQDILSSAPIDLETLQYLKAQLGEFDNKLIPMKFLWETEREVMASYMTPEKVGEIIPLLLGETEEDESEEIKIANELILAADEQFCQKNLDYYNKYWAAVFSSFELPYEQAYARLEKLSNKPSEEFKENPDATMAAILAPAVQKIYNNDVHRKTFSNALKTALEMYIINAQTNQLPKTLPDNLPKDLFSGKPFQYSKTAEGFILRCQGKDFVKNEIHEYEFKVKK